MNRQRLFSLAWVPVILVLAGFANAGYYQTAFDSPDAVNDWTVVSGTWTLDSNAGTYLASGGGSKLAAYQGPLNWDIPLAQLADYTVNADVIASGGDAGVVARFTNASNFYLFRLHSAEGLQIYKWVSGSATNLGANPTTEPIAGSHTLSFTVNGNQLTGKVYVEGNEVGSITVTDDSHTSGSVGFRGWSGSSTFSGIRVTSVQGPINIAPQNGARGILTNPILQWASAEDIDGNVIEGTAKYYLYASSGNASDPNVTFVAEIEADGAEASYDQLQLEMDKIYYWRVDQALSDAQGNAYLPGDPNNITGQLWSFESIKSTPVIDQQPHDIFVKAGDTAQIEISVATLSPEHYQWYKVVDGQEDQQVGEDSPILVFDPVAQDDRGLYYCIVTNDAGRAPASETAELILKTALAHWTMDKTDFVDGEYVDIAGDHNAVAQSTGATFIEGMDGTANGAVIIDPNSWANAGIWSPSAQTGQFTISMWMKWDGITGGHHRPIAKRSIDWTTTAWHVIINQGTNNIEFESYSYQGGAIGILDSASDQWQFVCVTFDGASAVMYIDGGQPAVASVGLTDSPDSPIIIGAGKADGTLAFNGALDDIRIYNYSLQPEEVAELWYVVTQETVCVNPPDARYDYNGDCLVNLADFADFAGTWLTCGYYPVTDCP